MRYGSVCSGIEAATVAWGPLEWTPVFFSEIEKFPSAVLNHHYSRVPNLGDFTQIKRNDYEEEIDLLVGGTPCQDYSAAGKRTGMAGDRGNLTLEFVRLLERTRPRWFLWENVPGVLSSNEGRDFGAFLWDLGGVGYGFAHRILDVQYVRVQHGFPRGIPQRRRRVFVVGYFGDWRNAAAVLFERESLSGHPEPGRTKGKGASSFAETGFGKFNKVESSASLRHSGGSCDMGSETCIVDIPRAMQAVHGTLRADAGAARFTGDEMDYPPILTSYGKGVNTTGHQGDRVFGDGDCLACLTSDNANNGGGGWAILHQNMFLRRLTPVECERLMGFPDDHTKIPWSGKSADQCPDTPRYRALGNSMGVNVIRWLGLRVQFVEDFIQEKVEKNKKTT